MKSVIRLTLAALIIFAAYVYMRFNIDISQYQGDGKIHKVGYVFIDNGYVVEFDSLQLDNNLEKKYFVKKVPKIIPLWIRFISNSRC